MAAPLIESLIDKVDGFELVRNELGAILLAETTNQALLAIAASKDPNLWRLRVFSERSNPWGEFEALPESDAPFVQPLPIVNVWYSGSTYDKSASNTFERQKAVSTFNVDCFVYGVSQDIPGGGHRPGDEVAQLELQRVVRLVRNVLMAATYTYLGLRGFVWGRWLSNVQIMEPAESRAGQRIGAARLVLTVDHNEFAPQVSGDPLELLSVSVKRGATGQLYFTANFPT